MGTDREAMQIAPVMLPPEDWAGELRPYAEERGTCPRCKAAAVVHRIAGMPAGPQVFDLFPDWVHHVGCVVPMFHRTCSACVFEWNADETGSMVLEHESRLYTLYEASDADELGRELSEHLELDAYIDPQSLTGGFTVIIQTTGTVIEFPTTLAQFWEQVRDLEDQVIEELEEAAAAEEAELEDE